MAGVWGDTIAAISTPVGLGGLAIVRISGPQALAVAGRCFQPVGRRSLNPTAAPSHTLQYGRVVLHDRVVDHVLLAVFRAPRSATENESPSLSL